VDHTCIECGGLVRVRRGEQRQDHFFHLQTVEGCSQQAKTAEHLQVQFYFEGLLGSTHCSLEQRFPQIQRIADVVWWPQKIVFEVQCSSISAEEVEARNRDYASQGFQVVWILHERRFNGERLSAAETLLRNCPHYFTDMNGDGVGGIYDQFDIVTDGVRILRLAPLPVDLSRPLFLENKRAASLARVRERMGKLCFSGDLVDVSLGSPQHGYIVSARVLESRARRLLWRDRLYRVWHAFVARPYTIALEMLLEKASR
jgi:competence protein CoiA